MAIPGKRETKFQNQIDPVISDINEKIHDMPVAATFVRI
jgi:hypothetical protein